jgi:hypothetical protein
VEISHFKKGWSYLLMGLIIHATLNLDCLVSQMTYFALFAL